jgi:hypothetical protein
VTPARAAVRAVGLWRPTPGAPTPPPRLPPRLRRRASLLVNMVAEVATQTTEAAGVSLASVPLVVGSAFGELGTTVDILRDINQSDGQGIVSPTDFQASVHNTAAAYLSIAYSNRLSSTSIAAGDETAAAVLLEALTLLAVRGGQALAIVADEPLPDVLHTGGAGVAVATALLLEAPPGGGGAWPGPPPLAVLGDLRHAHALPRPVEPDAPSEAAARLVEAIRDRRWGRVELGLLDARGAASWSVAVSAGEGV